MQRAWRLQSPSSVGHTSEIYKQARDAFVAEQR